MGIKDLEKPIGQLQILVDLYNNGKLTRHQIIYEMGLNKTTARAALLNLIELKLIRVLKNDRLSLTRKGKKVAELLTVVNKEMIL